MPEVLGPRPRRLKEAVRDAAGVAARDAARPATDVTAITASRMVMEIRWTIPYAVGKFPAATPFTSRMVGVPRGGVFCRWGTREVPRTWSSRMAG